jgi:hypothetical protein
MVKTRKYFGALLIIILASTLAAEEKPLASEKLIQALREEISGEIAFNYTVLISHFDRIQASEGWHDSLYSHLAAMGRT